MPKLDAFPYLTCDPLSVQAEQWQIGEKGREEILPMLLKDWDPLAEIHMTRTIVLDLRSIYGTCGLSQDAEIVLAASWLSSGSTLKEHAHTVVLPKGNPRTSVNLSFKVQGSKLSGSLVLISRILLSRKGKMDSKLSAVILGSILWVDECTTHLEGLGARFPMEFADFADQGYPAAAGWRLYWKRDFSAQVMGSMWLLINSRHERLRGITSGAIIDPESAAILETIHYSVARDLIVGGIENPDFVQETQNFPKGSIGEAITMLIRRLFEGESPESVLQIYRDDLGRFECILQDKLLLFRKQKN